MKTLPPVVVALGMASLFTDWSSEMIYPLLPLFLAGELGAGALAVGAIEGMAETVSALLKVIGGRWTDRVRRRAPFVFAGYGIAGAVRPLIGLATAWPAVFALRFADRIGKGLRTAPRDALIADAVDAGARGRAFGFHRAMDHAGAIAGPLTAAALMGAAGFSMRTVFLCAAVPAVCAMIALAWRVRDPAPVRGAPAGGAAAGDDALPMGRAYWTVIAAVLLFALGNSTDAFILLRLNEAGLDAAWVAALWAVHHAVKLVSAYYCGALSDRVGRRPLVLAGWGIYVAVYAGFALAEGLPALVALFLVYGLYYGCCEPVERAWVVDLAPAGRRGAALGYYHGAVGLAALPASLAFGAVYQGAGPPVAFLMGGFLALAACALIALAPRRNAA